MKILPISCLKDNYAYLLICEKSQQVGVVDPSEAEPVLAALAALDLPLHVVLNTHHHWDHTGGNEALKARFPALQIWGHASDRGRIAGQSHFLEDDQNVQLGQLQGRVIHNPGHTSGAVSYHFENTLFTGDTLFGAGCGRTFEGTASQMQASLQRLAALPGDTRCYFGHEYTRSNLRFAQAVEPNNPAITERLDRLQSPSTPSTLAEELRSNPFLRCDQPAVIAAAAAREPGLNASDPAEIFRVLRAWKDDF